MRILLYSNCRDPIVPLLLPTFFVKRDILSEEQLHIEIEQEYTFVSTLLCFIDTKNICYDQPALQVTIRILDMSGIQMVESCPVAKWSGVQIFEWHH